jgi:membrane protein
MGLVRDFKDTYRLGGLSLKELGGRVVNESLSDNITGFAAELAYYFLFALFPFLLFLTALIGYIPIPDLFDRILALLAAVMPSEALTLIKDTLREVVSNQKGGLLSVGILLSVWTASSAVAAIGDALNSAYGVRDTRPFWKTRGIAILLTIALAAMVLGSMILLVFGPQLGHWIANFAGLGAVFDIVWNLVRWPLTIILLVLGAAVLYYFLPDVEQQWKWITPGSVFAVIAWILASLAFSYYVNNFSSYNATYGSIGAVIVLLTWMYLTGLFLLVGGEINAEIEHASAEGKAPGHKKLPEHEAPAARPGARKGTKKQTKRERRSP